MNLITWVPIRRSTGLVVGR